MASNSITSSEEIVLTVVQLVQLSEGANGRERERWIESESKRGKKGKLKNYQQAELASPNFEVKDTIMENFIN